MFMKLDSGDSESLGLRLAISEGPYKIGVSIPSPEHPNRTSFGNVVFSSYLEFGMIGKVPKPSDSECYAPSPEPFRFYLIVGSFTKICQCSALHKTCTQFCAVSSITV
jgi:hypothetical protein